jgi:hypothetical protein
LADLLEVSSQNLILDLFQNLVHSLRASPCQRTDDLASRFLGEGELPGGSVLQLDDLLSERQLPGSAGGQIDSSNGNPDVGVDNDDHPLERTLRLGFSARTSFMSRGTSASV